MRRQNTTQIEFQRFAQHTRTRLGSVVKTTRQWKFSRQEIVSFVRFSANRFDLFVSSSCCFFLILFNEIHVSTLDIALLYMVQKMPIVTEPVQTKLTETPLEPIGPLDTKVSPCLVSRTASPLLLSGDDRSLQPKMSEGCRVPVFMDLQQIYGKIPANEKENFADRIFSSGGNRQYSRTRWYSRVLHSLHQLQSSLGRMGDDGSNESEGIGAAQFVGVDEPHDQRNARDASSSFGLDVEERQIRTEFEISSERRRRERSFHDDVRLVRRRDDAERRFGSFSVE